MTIEYRDSPQSVRIVECPFCGVELRDRDVPPHLEKCDAFLALGKRSLTP
jgi:hypothetical protein